MEIALTYDPRPAARVAEAVKKRMIARHGREDFTVLTQDTCWRRCRTSSICSPRRWCARGDLAAGGRVGIVTIMSIAVTERTGEIGLLVALGASAHHPRALPRRGGGAGGHRRPARPARRRRPPAQLVGLLVPAMPVATPWRYALAAEGSPSWSGSPPGSCPHAGRHGSTRSDLAREEPCGARAVPAPPSHARRSCKTTALPGRLECQASRESDADESAAPPQPTSLSARIARIRPARTISPRRRRARAGRARWPFVEPGEERALHPVGLRPWMKRSTKTFAGDLGDALISTLPGLALMLGPRAVRARPETRWMACW